jgi:hypothetical protein
MTTIIEAKKDLYNAGKCFTKGKQYTVNGYITQPASLMEKYSTNDLNELHLIGSWWREFKIIVTKDDKGREINQ